jgi:cellulose synthase/poly-beta-1,6-N-acetylglucosamine synthase-like glycosyltransferase
MVELWREARGLLGEAAVVVHLGALLVLAIYGCHRVWLTLGALAAWRAQRRASSPSAAAPSAAALGAVPWVTVQLPLYNEPAVAARLIDAVTALDWPRDRLEIQVLDDSTDETSAICAERVADAAARGLRIVHLRRPARTGFKAGALEAGRARASGELLAVLDSDFVVPPSFLRDSVAPFADPQVAMVQTRWEHLNRQASLLTRVQALLLDGHFAIEQRARAHRGHIFNFNGTAGIWRAEAINHAGGWHADTLTEDLDLSYRVALSSSVPWRFVFLEGVGVPAELPEKMTAFRSQQFRWAKGSVEVAIKLAGTVVRSPRRWRDRLEGLFHLTHNLPYFATAVLVASGVLAADLGARPWSTTLTWVTAALTALVLCGYVLIAQWLLQRPRWFASITLIPAMTALVAGISIGQARGIGQALRGRRSEFVRTPKTGSVPRAAPRTTARRPAAAYVPEAALGTAALVATLLTAQRDVWFSATPLALFCLGLWWVAFGSLHE